jgi:hypothetical protein
VPIREAAKACGIPEDELLQYVSENLQKPAEISYELKRLAEATLIKGIKKLKEIADDGPRMEDEMTKYNNADLVAAQTLAKIGMDILKLSVSHNPEGKAKSVGATIQLDLWDQPGAWELKKPGA